MAGTSFCMRDTKLPAQMTNDQVVCHLIRGSSTQSSARSARDKKPPAMREEDNRRYANFPLPLQW